MYFVPKNFEVIVAYSTYTGVNVIAVSPIRTLIYLPFFHTESQPSSIVSILYLGQ